MHNLQPLHLLFVVNPVSGGNDKTDWQKSITEYFHEKPHTADIFLLNGNDDQPRLQKQIEQLAPEMVVAVGGDGTVKMVAELIRDTSIILGILPAGSANGMAKELEIPNGAAAFDVLVNGRIKPIDLIEIDSKHTCIHLSDIGLNATLIKYFETGAKRGMWGYTIAIVKALWTKKKMHVTIDFNHETIKRDAYMVAIANAKKYGTGATINPNGDLSDGAFEVVIVRKISIDGIFKSIFTNAPFNPENIEVISTNAAAITIHRKAHLQIDGEFLGNTTRVEARSLPKAVFLMVPAREEL